MSDLKSVADILSSIDTQVSQLSICDNYQLGKYQPNRSRPILVKMTRSSEVSSILSNRHKLTSQPGIFIKADLAGVRGSGMSGEGEVFLSFTDLISCHQVEPDELGAVDWPSVVPSL